jgi:isomerase DpgB
MNSQGADAPLETRIDGARPLSADVIADLAAVCDKVERDNIGSVVIHVSGAPVLPSSRDLTIGLVSNWERVLRRVERLPAVTVGIAEGECAGAAFEALLATDYRIALLPMRLLLPVSDGATWPGMGLYRLVRQAGGSQGRRSVLFGAALEVGDALRMQLIDEVAEDSAQALALAALLAASVSGPEVAIRRQLMLETPASSFEDALGVHLAACDRALRRASADAKQ